MATMTPRPTTHDDAAAPGAGAGAGVGDDLAHALDRWYRRAARDLPWRHADAGPWAILVSEVMLAQTPVNRVVPVYRQWVARWPTPAALADASGADVIRAWGRLGYPRRALRLHETARLLVERHGGTVPDDLHALLALPGVGAYTARAVLVFAFGRRHPVVDTNVRRVTARLLCGTGAAGPASAARDHAATERLLPPDPTQSAGVSIALMELGALVCTASDPRCGECPVSAQCAWLRAGRPAYDGPRVRQQRFAGTDRQVRGLLMDVLRRHDGPVERSLLDLAWSEPEQRDRALASLLADGLARHLEDGRYALPG